MCVCVSVSDSMYTVSGSALRHPKGAVEEGWSFSVWRLQQHLCICEHACVRVNTRLRRCLFSEDVQMMRSVCAPFLSGPASNASSFVPLTHLYVLGFFFFFTVLCHDQFAARHMTAPSASGDLRDFVCNPSLPRFLSPHTKRAFVFLSRFGH